MLAYLVFTHFALRESLKEDMFHHFPNSWNEADIFVGPQIVLLPFLSVDVACIILLECVLPLPLSPQVCTPPHSSMPLRISVSLCAVVCAALVAIKPLTKPWEMLSLHTPHHKPLVFVLHRSLSSASGIVTIQLPFALSQLALKLLSQYFPEPLQYSPSVFLHHYFHPVSLRALCL